MLTRTQLELLFVATTAIVVGLIGYFVLGSEASNASVVVLMVAGLVVASAGVSMLRRRAR